MKRAKSILLAALLAINAVLIVAPGLAAVVVDGAKTGFGYFTTVQVASGGSLDAYNTSPISATDYERLRVDVASNVFRVWTQNDGTGSERALRVGTVTSDGLTAPTVYTQWQGGSVPYIDSVIPSNASTTALGLARFTSGNLTAASGTQTYLNIAPVFAQTGTAAGIAALVNPSGTFGSAGGKLQSWQLASSEVASMNSVGSLFIGGVLRTASGLGFGSTLGASDLELVRDAADVLACRRSTNPCTIRAYNFYTDASNYERGGLAWSTNSFVVGTEAAGTGTARDLVLAVGGTGRWVMPGTTGHMLAVADNTYDIGAAAATRPRTGHFGTSVVAPTLVMGTSTVAGLATCNAAAIGSRKLVTDANATTFASTVAAGGANIVPVTCTGAAWIIGRAANDDTFWAAA